MGDVPIFLPSAQGLHYANSWPSAPVVEVPTPFGNVNIGDAKHGLCGGMAYAVRDLFEKHAAPPPQTANPLPTSPAFHFMTTRLIDSFDLPEGVAKYYEWMNLPTGDEFLVHGTSRRTIEVSMPFDSRDDRRWAPVSARRCVRALSQPARPRPKSPGARVRLHRHRHDHHVAAVRLQPSRRRRRDDRIRSHEPAPFDEVQLLLRRPHRDWILSEPVHAKGSVAAFPAVTPAERGHVIASLTPMRLLRGLGLTGALAIALTGVAVLPGVARAACAPSPSLLAPTGSPAPWFGSGLMTGKPSSRRTTARQLRLMEGRSVPRSGVRTSISCSVRGTKSSPKTPSHRSWSATARRRRCSLSRRCRHRRPRRPHRARCLRRPPPPRLLNSRCFRRRPRSRIL